MIKRGLGKGLDALFGEMPDSLGKKSFGDSLSEKNVENIKEIDLKEIAPNKFQPRQNFDQEQLLELAASIKEVGIIQPVVVRKTETGYELVYGERRRRAAEMANLTKIPAIVREYCESQMLQIALIENIQRQNLNPMEEAHAYRQLMDEFSMTQEELSQKVGRSRTVIANFVRLLKLHPEIQKFVAEGELSMGQAKPLLALEDAKTQLETAFKIIEEEYSARDAEELVKNILADPLDGADILLEEILPPKRKPNYAMLGGKEYANEFEERLRLVLGTKVKIKPGKLKSKIEIEFYSSEDLERILDTFATGTDKPTEYSAGKELIV